MQDNLWLTAGLQCNFMKPIDELNLENITTGIMGYNDQPPSIT